MHPPANAVTGVIPNNSVSVLFRMFLNYRANVAHTFVRTALIDTEGQALFGNADKLF